MARAVKAGEHLDAVLIDALVEEVGEALEDCSAVTCGDLREGFRKLCDHFDGAFERSNEVGTKVRSPLVVPFPGLRNV